jgi:hypothetical protein
MKELKLEAAAWELYDREIRVGILGEEQPPQMREGVNHGLMEVYETLEPFLEVQRRLSMAEGYRQALNEYGLPTDDPQARTELEAERGWIDEIISGHRSRISGLRVRYQHELRRVAMLHAIRDKLPPPNDEELREREPP